MKLSIVTTLYQSAPYLEEFYTQMSAAAAEITHDYEIIMVNDGSPDASLALALKLHEKDPRVSVVDLSRNFGEHKARMTGLSHATGDYVFMIQCDLEVSPHCLVNFWVDMQSFPEVDYITGVQEKKRGSVIERVCSTGFYKLFNMLSDVKLGLNEASVRLMSRRFADALLEHKERSVFFAGLCQMTGFGQKEHAVVKTRSNKGSYSLRKKMAMVVNAVTAYSTMPLVIVFYLGLGISVLTAMYIAMILVKKMCFDIEITGWTSLIVSVWFFGGVIMASVGLVGLYISRIFIEVKQRPYTIVKQFYKGKP